MKYLYREFFMLWNQQNMYNSAIALNSVIWWRDWNGLENTEEMRTWQGITPMESHEDRKVSKIVSWIATVV